MKTTIVHSNILQANNPLILPYVGKVFFDANCECEVENAEDAQLLAALDMGISIKPVPVSEVKKAAKKEPEKEVAPVDPNAGNEGQGGSEGENANGAQENDENKELIDHVKSMKTVKELKQLASDSGLPEKDWKSMKVKQVIVDYIITQLSA